jgi:hypothetical protein
MPRCRTPLLEHVSTLDDANDPRAKKGTRPCATATFQKEVNSASWTRGKKGWAIHAHWLIDAYRVLEWGGEYKTIKEKFFFDLTLYF